MYARVVLAEDAALQLGLSLPHFHLRQHVARLHVFERHQANLTHLRRKHAVIGFSPSRERLMDMRERYFCECDAGGMDLWRVDLGNDEEVRRNVESAVYSHGPPDLVVTSLGCLPRAWHRRSVQGGLHGDPVQLVSWNTPAPDWTRFLGDVRGVANVARHVLPEVRVCMCERQRERAPEVTCCMWPLSHPSTLAKVEGARWERRQYSWREVRNA
jgi:hypothetical protein